MSISPAPESILSVSALTRLIKDALGQAFPAIWVKGELSGFKRSDRGHLYFSLKEGTTALIDCVMWSRTAGRLSFEPRDGTEVEAFGAISVYEPRGRYQLVVEELRPGGLGALLLALEELKRRLQAEGLFEAARKRPLPRFPARIGLVTSPVGAAVRDLVKVLRTRWPGIGIVLAPVRVQGEGAAAEIAAAIERFNRYMKVDLLIVGRGGGSLEDLWAFNEEPVVRAIATSRLPVISAVGHEVDWTLADMAADVRAATPSNAAEIAVRDQVEVRQRIAALDARGGRALRQGLEERRRRLRELIEKYGFRRQRDALGYWQQRVDDLLERLRVRLRDGLSAARERLASIQGRYGLREWPRTLVERRGEITIQAERLTTATVGLIHAGRIRLAGYQDRLRALSPRLVMERGYCLARRPDGTLLRVATELSVGDPITVEFARGEVDARVETVRHGEDDARE
jgi:exodeoxyribonuclease VII large subunit